MRSPPSRSERCTLSGLSTDNSGTGFGIKQATSGSVVKVMAADSGFPADKLKVALTPDSTIPYDPIGGDFFFIDVVMADSPSSRS